jgi:hypothetical protein
LKHLFIPLGMCCLLIPCGEEIIRGAEDLKSEKEEQDARQDAYGQPKRQERKDHRKTSTLHHKVPSRSHNEGRILR